MVPVSKRTMDRELWHEHIVKVARVQIHEVHERHKLKLFAYNAELNEKKERMMKKADDKFADQQLINKKEQLKKDLINFTNRLNIIG